MASSRRTRPTPQLATAPSAGPFDNYHRATTLSVAFVLPMIGLLAMTSQWNQRTALTTFTTSTWRLRVFTAKLLAALVARSSSSRSRSG